MNLDQRQGIALASGFILNAKSLLDMRECNDTIQELQTILDGGANPEGLTSFIKEDEGFYLYTGSKLVNLRALVKGATDSENGAAGLVPAPMTTDSGKFLNADGTWKAIPAYSNVTEDAAGLMTPEDKIKLDGIATGANNYVHPSYTTAASGLYKIAVDATGHVSSVTLVTKKDLIDLGIADGDNVYTDFIGASADSDGTNGLVPKPVAGQEEYFLAGDGTWKQSLGDITIDKGWGFETTDIP